MTIRPNIETKKVGKQTRIRKQARKETNKQTKIDKQKQKKNK